MPACHVGFEVHSHGIRSRRRTTSAGATSTTANCWMRWVTGSTCSSPSTGDCRSSNTSSVGLSESCFFERARIDSSTCRRWLRSSRRPRNASALVQSPLDGYCRLRVGGYRIVFAYGARATIECVFAEQRSIVYALLLDRVRSGDE